MHRVRSEAKRLAPTAFFLMVPVIFAPEALSSAHDPKAPMQDAEIVAALLRSLESPSFREREQASAELAKLEVVPEALREAARSDKLEVSRRAQRAIRAITVRREERAFAAMIQSLSKVEIDRLVHRMVTEKCADEMQWETFPSLVKVVASEANRVAGREFKVPAFQTKELGRLLLDQEKEGTSAVDGAILLSYGDTPYFRSVSRSIVVVDGDFLGATSIQRSVVIVRGNVGAVTALNESIVIATGFFEGASRCEASFLQVSNSPDITTAEDSVVYKTPVPQGDEAIQDERDLGPLRAVRLSPRKRDDELAWGQESGGLVLAIMPAERPDQFLLRWKNVSGEVIEVPWGRVRARFGEDHHDDLLGGVFLRDAAGKLASARKATGARRPRSQRAFSLLPGQTHEERIDLWSYVERPAGRGAYHLWIDARISGAAFATWQGDIRSNALDLNLDK